jgi:hypothetical protein
MNDPIRDLEGLTRADAEQPLRCANCEATILLSDHDAAEPADVGWLHRQEDGIENYCPECRGAVERDAERQEADY